MSALREAGWRVHRVEDEGELGKGTPNDRVFANAAARGWVWLSRDEAALRYPVAWQGEGKPFTGMLIWSQRYHRRMSPGQVVRQIEALGRSKIPS